VTPAAAAPGVLVAAVGDVSDDWVALEDTDAAGVRVARPVEAVLLSLWELLDPEDAVGETIGAVGSQEKDGRPESTWARFLTTSNVLHKGERILAVARRPAAQKGRPALSTQGAYDDGCVAISLVAKDRSRGGDDIAVGARGEEVAGLGCLAALSKRAAA